MDQLYTPSRELLRALANKLWDPVHVDPRLKWRFMYGRDSITLLNRQEVLLRIDALGHETVLDLEEVVRTLAPELVAKWTATIKAEQARARDSRWEPYLDNVRAHCWDGERNWVIFVAWLARCPVNRIAKAAVLSESRVKHIVGAKLRQAVREGWAHVSLEEWRALKAAKEVAE